MSLKITTLIENSADKDSDLQHEHGLSFFIEKDGTRMLFDTGQTARFLSNAEKLGADLSALDFIAISHGHYDHSGGFPFLLKKTGGFELVVGSGFFAEKYSQRKTGLTFAGNDFSEKDLAEKGIPCRTITEPVTEIAPGLFVLIGFPRLHPEELVNPRFFLKKDEDYVPDLFNDEIMLVLDTPKGLVVVIGCSHPGIRNMLDAVKSRFDKPVYAVLGGTHLIESSDENLDLCVKYFKDEKIKHLGVSHCTGDKAMKRLAVEVPGYFHNMTGSVLIV